MSKPPVSKVAAKSTPNKAAAKPFAKSAPPKPEPSAVAAKAPAEAPKPVAAPAVKPPMASPAPAAKTPVAAKKAEPAPAPAAKPAQTVIPATTQEVKPMTEVKTSSSETVATPAAASVEAPAAATPAPAAEDYLITSAPAPSVEAPAAEAEVLPPEAAQTETPKARRWAAIFTEEFSMSTFPTFDFAAPFQSMFADFQEKSKAAYEKSTAAMGDYSEFAKGNVEAMVEASKIFATGLQELTSTFVADSRAGFETLTAEVKELAAAKSPTDFLKLQNDLAKKHFDEAVAAASKSSEALVKLSTEAAKPITTRVSLAVEKIKTAA
ncbi:phasin family protein [Novosphingobium umbonatum]|nr:phasin family protein [Novosphingobium umbonatum]